MFESESRKEKRSVDWSGTLIAALLLPVLFIFISLGKPDLGFTACIVLGMALLAIRLRWSLRRHLWFWATIVLLLVFHIPLLLLVRWPHTGIPTIFYSLPLGIADFLVTMSCIDLVKGIFAGSASG